MAGARRSVLRRLCVRRRYAAARSHRTDVNYAVRHSFGRVCTHLFAAQRTNAAGVGGGGGLRVRPSVCTPPVWLLLLISERAMCRVRRAEAYRPDSVFGPRRIPAIWACTDRGVMSVSTLDTAGTNAVSYSHSLAPSIVRTALVSSES